MLRMVSDTRTGVLSWFRKTRLVIEDLLWSAAKADLQQSGDRPVRTGPLLTPVGVPCHRHSPVVMRPALSRSPAFTGEGNHMPTPGSCQHRQHNSGDTAMPAQAS